MSIDDRSYDDAKNNELENLPERPIADADKIKGGASAPPTRRVAVPVPKDPRLIIPCI
jgi:hypothetical protein